MTDDTSRLLMNHSNHSVPSIRFSPIQDETYGSLSNSAISHGGSSPKGTPSKRPPIFSIPSTTSVRSHKSLNSFNNDIGNYVSKRKPIESSLGTYVSYYFPIFTWLPSYQKIHLVGDVLAGVSLASFQMPLAMSFATSLGHLPPSAGLYSILIASIIYPVMGGVPILVVGPGGSIALMYGQIVDFVRDHPNVYNMSAIEVAGVMTFTLGGILLATGLMRFGFLDNVLSRALLKGFLGALGSIMIINELIPELGLALISEGSKEPHGTTYEKIMFLVHHYKESHVLTASISSVSIVVILMIRKIKKVLVKNGSKSAVFFPELLLLVIITTFLSFYCGWEERGVDIIGEIKTGKSHIVNPIHVKSYPVFQKYLSTSFLCAMLGYFEHTTATKALGAQYNYNVSSNRELIALGLTNMAASFCGALPTFGGFGRSKINISCGATTQMSALIMAVVVLFCITFLMPYLYHLPECILALTTTIVGITILEDLPEDLLFFWRIRGYDELFTGLIIFVTTFFWSAEAGISFGVGLAVVRVIKHSTRSRIQILGRIPNTTVFRNADELIEETFANSHFTEQELTQEQNDSSGMEDLVAEIESIEGCLIVKIPEPLTFANVGDLRNRLSRIEKYGSLLIHPSHPRLRQSGTTKCLIIDLKGMSKIDSSAAQGLYEITKSYTEKGIRVIFTRIPTDPKIRELFRTSGIVHLVQSKKYPISRTHSQSNLLYGLGDGFYSSIDDALREIDTRV